MPVNNSLTNIHTITIRQPMIHLFGSRRATTISNEQSMENSKIRE